MHSSGIRGLAGVEWFTRSLGIGPPPVVTTKGRVSGNDPARKHSMPTSTINIRLSYLLTLTAADVALALGCVGRDPVLSRWTSRFCGLEPGGCTLGSSDANDLVAAVERLVRRYRAARAGGVSRAIVANLDHLFWLFHDAIERCVDVDDDDCVCSWQRRIGDAEELTSFLVEVARAYWSTGAEREWMSRDLERLACRICDVSERDGSIARRADDDPSVEARAGRLAVLVFDAANDLCCDNWANEPWMSVVPGA